MIYACYNCGWNINARTLKDKYGNVTTDFTKTNVGEHMLYDHKAFCSEYCIEVFKMYPKPRQPIQDFWENGEWGDWKKERKIGRVRKPKFKLHSIKSELFKPKPTS